MHPFADPSYIIGLQHGLTCIDVLFPLWLCRVSKGCQIIITMRTILILLMALVALQQSLAFLPPIPSRSSALSSTTIQRPVPLTTNTVPQAPLMRPQGESDSSLDLTYLATCNEEVVQGPAIFKQRCGGQMQKRFGIYFIGGFGIIGLEGRLVPGMTPRGDQ